MSNSIPDSERAVNLWNALESGELELSDLTIWEKWAVIVWLEGML